MNEGELKQKTYDGLVDKKNEITETRNKRKK